MQYLNSCLVIVVLYVVPELLKRLPLYLNLCRVCCCCAVLIIFDAVAAVVQYLLCDEIVVVVKYSCWLCRNCSVGTWTVDEIWNYSRTVTVQHLNFRCGWTWWCCSVPCVAVVVLYTPELMLLFLCSTWTFASTTWRRQTCSATGIRPSTLSRHSLMLSHPQCLVSYMIIFWSASFSQRAKKLRETLISTVFWLPNDFLSLKTDVHVPTIRNKPKT